MSGEPLPVEPSPVGPPPTDAPRPEMLMYREQNKQLADPAMMMLGALLVVGLVCIVITAWVLYGRQQVRVRAQQDEIRQLRSKLLETSKALATVYVQETHAAQQALALERAQRKVVLFSTRTAMLTPTVAVRATWALTFSTALDRPPLALILDVPAFRQRHNLGCEASCAAMAAHFFGVAASEDDILAALPRDENPHKGFRGSKDGLWGGLQDYGVYAGPLGRVLTDLGLEAVLLSGGPEEIREHLRHGRVVVAWVTYNLAVQQPQTVVLGGETVILVPYEHTVLIVGYNGDGFWVNDPYPGAARFFVESEFVRSFGYLDNMALVVGPGL